MSVAVEAQGVRKEYAALTAVEDLTFAIEAGEILGVLGPNGAGKTTAIRILTTILTPTRGSFTVAGIPHTRAGEIRQRIGVLPESAGFPEQQTGSEYLQYHARLYGQSSTGARATSAELLREVGLYERGDSVIDTYSRGMKQRLGIARALVNSPDVVFLDEPTLGLDPAGQRQMLALVRLIAQQRGATVLLSTHLLAEVEETCTRVLILNGGRVAAEGTVADVARRAAAPRSARLRVPADDVDEALLVLSREPGIRTASRRDGLPGTLTLSLEEQDGTSTGAVLGRLAAGGIPVLAFELEGARLSDAFLAMTEGADGD